MIFSFLKINILREEIHIAAVNTDKGFQPKMAAFLIKAVRK